MSTNIIGELWRNLARKNLRPSLRDESTYKATRFARHKTEIEVELGMNKELAGLWQWFIKMKKKEQIISLYLLVNPRYFDTRSRAELATHRTLQKAWRKACKEAGYGDLHPLSDFRKKGLTEKYVTRGENDKGGRKTQAIADHYELMKFLKRAGHTIRLLYEETGKSESTKQLRAELSAPSKAGYLSMYL